MYLNRLHACTHGGWRTLGIYSTHVQYIINTLRISGEAGRIWIEGEGGKEGTRVPPLRLRVAPAAGVADVSVTASPRWVARERAAAAREGGEVGRRGGAAKELVVGAAETEGDRGRRGGTAGRAAGGDGNGHGKGGG